jgi:fibronectin-binding autotransporter adhesin
MKTPLKTCRLVCRLLCFLFASALPGFAQVTWTNGGPDLLWTTPANWSTGIAPTSADPVIFGNASTTNAAGPGAVNNIVSANQTVRSLSYSITNIGVNYHNTQLSPGVTLTLSDAAAGNTLFVGSGTDAGANQLIATNSIFGAGTLDFENTSGSINVRQGTGTGTVGVGGTNHAAVLNMTGLDKFVANAGRFLISGDGGGGANVSRLVGVVYLAKTNTIALSGTAPQLLIGEQPSNGRANPPIGLLPSYLFLGQTNAIFADVIRVGGSKSPAVSMLFNPAFVNPSAYFRGQTAERVTTYSIGDNSVQTTSNQGSDGTNDFSGGAVDIKADTLYVGRGESGGGNAAGTGGGVLIYGPGIVDVNNLEVGYQSASGAGSAIGNVQINGGTLLVSGNLRLARYVGGAGVPQGTLSANNATITVGGLQAGGGVVNFSLANSTLTSVSNAFGAVGSALSSFGITNSTLSLPTVNGGASVTTTNLNLGGATNKINISSMPVLSGYPSVLPIIKYSALSGTPNIGLGTLPVSVPAFKGYLTNDTTGQVFSLVLTNGPATARALIWTGSAATQDWDQDATANWKTNGGAPTTFHDLDFVRFDDTAATNFVSLSGFPLLPSTVVVSNSTKNYTFGGGGFLSGAMPLTKQGTGKLTLDNNSGNDFTGNLIISSGTVQVGQGDSFGTVGAGSVVNNGTLILNRTDFYSFTNSISGSGSVVMNTNGVVVLSGGNSFDGSMTVTSGGTLIVDNVSALGSTNGGTVIANGARLDLGGSTLATDAFNPGLESFTVSGSGPDGNGALYNSLATRQQNAFRLLTLAGDTVLGGSGRFDIRGAGATLDTTGHPYSLIKTGFNEVVIVDTAVDPALGDIDIQQGQLQIQGNTTSLGNSASNLYVRAGASLFLNATTNLLDKVFNLFGDGSTLTVSQTAGSSTVVGPMILNGDTRFNVVNGANTLTLSNVISGSGSLTMVNPGTNTLAMVGPAKTYTGGTTINFGKFLLNTILAGGGGLTNTLGAQISGNGTNVGPAEFGGIVSPGAAGVPGTLTVGGGLTIQGDANLNVDFGPDNTPGAGSNDLIRVTGNVTTFGGTVNVNPMGLLKVGQPYRLITYTGGLTTSGALFAQGPNNYTFTVNTSTPGQINIIASGGPSVWNGGSAVNSFWSDALNWGGTGISDSQTVYFAGNNRLVNTNDTANVNYGLGFDTSAGSFSLYGNPITLSDNIVSTSPNVQNINLDLTLNSAKTIDGGNGGGIFLGGFITNTINNNVLTLAGNGSARNQFYSSDPTTVTNVLRLTTASANWTWLDNPSSTAVTNPIQLDILAGTLNFGTVGSAPVLASTTAQGVPQDQRLGNVANTTATLNMVNGSLTTLSRLNTGATSGSTGIVNQVGGTLTIGGQFQGANATGGSSIVNVSGGVMNIRDTQLRQLYVASRGPGVLNVSGNAVVNCSVLDVSRSINSDIPGTVNLNGGTIAANSVGTATANSGAGTTGSVGTFNFNGGVLKANANSTTFFQGHASAPVVPLIANVKAGGAIIDSGTNSISFLEPLQHDAGLGATADGGLTKLGSGTLTLAAANTYNGLTTVSNGTLLVSGSLSTGAVTVATSGTLAGTGSVGGAVTVNGTIAPGSATAIGKLTVNSNVTITGVSAMKLDKVAGTNDVLAVNGTLTYGGVLSLTNLTGTLVGGESFKLFSAGAYNGSFSSIDPATPGVNLTWDTSGLSSGIVAVVSTSIGPTTNASITKVSLVGTNLVVHGTNNNVPSGNFHYVVLTTTNIATRLTNWTPVVTNSFNPDGSFDYTNAVVPGVRQQFIEVQVVP